MRDAGAMASSGSGQLGHSIARSTYSTAIALPWDPGRTDRSHLTLLGGLARHDVGGERLSFGAQKM